MDQKERDRAARKEKHSRFTDAEDRPRDRSTGKPGMKGIVYISNIPPETPWMALKDFFRRKVGEVSFVEIKNSLGKIEFCNVETMKKAMSMADKLIFRGSKLIINDSELAAPTDRRPVLVDDFGRNGGMPPGASPVDKYNTYGLSVQFLEGLGIKPPLVPNVFVSNVEFSVDAKKIKEVFKLAGKIRQITVPTDREGKTRGFCTIRYSHPVEAVQAISMFNNQYLNERKLNVRLDHNVQEKSFKMPQGLRGIGPGLGPNGEPLEDVANNLPNKPPPEPPAMPPDDMVMPNQMNPMGPTPNMGMPNMGMPNMGMGNMGSLNPATLQALNLLQNQLLQQSQGGVPSPNMPNMGFGMNSGPANAGPVNSMNSHSARLRERSEPEVTYPWAAGGEETEWRETRGGFGGGPNDNNSMEMNKKIKHRDFDDQDQGNRMGSNMPNMRPNSGPNSGPNQGPNAGPNRGEPRESPIQQKVSDMVFINNLPPNISWQILREKFGECGEVKCAELTGSNSAIVRFQRDWDAQRAVKMFDGTLIDDHIINCRFY